MSSTRSRIELETLYEISKTLSLTTDINKAFTSALNILSLYMGLENGTLSLLDQVTGEVFLEAAPEMTDEERILGRLRPGEGVVGRIFSLGVPVVIHDIAKEPTFLNRTGSWRNIEKDPRAFIGVPLKDGRTTLGVLSADRRHSLGPPHYDADIKVLTTIAHLMAARVLLMQRERRHRDARVESLDGGRDHERFPDIICESRSMRDVLGLVVRVAKSRATVLLRGESGTGKELLARAVHDASPRAERAFIAVNCAAIPEALLESDLFGHDRGAFTSATTTHQGRFERADGGTLFLDEVGDLPLHAQAKFLRVLQERQFERVGGQRVITVDVRLVAATNRNLEDMVRAGTFRLDLYHRLSVVSIVIPPLRERPDDIPKLTAHFLGQINAEHECSATLSDEALDLLRRCRFTGNARQLRNCLERAVVASGHHRLGASDFSCTHDGCFQEAGLCACEGLAATPQAAPTLRTAVLSSLGERDRVMAALERCGFVQAKAARLLGLTVRQLGYRVLKYNIDLKRF